MEPSGHPEIRSVIPIVERVSGKAWLYWGVAALAYLVAVHQRSSFGVASLDAADRYQVGPAILSLFPVVQLVAYSLSQIPVGVALDHFGPRRMITIGAIIMGLGQLTLALSSIYPIAILGRAVVGIGDAMTFISVLRVTTAWFPPSKNAMMTQIIGLLGWFGQLLSAIPFAFILRTQSWTISFVILTVSAVLVGISSYAIIRDRNPELLSNTWPRRRDLVDRVKNTWAHPATKIGFWSHWSSPFSTNMFSLLWGVPFLVKGEGMSQSQASTSLTSIVVCGALAGVAFGYLIGKFPNHLDRLSYGVCILIATYWAVIILWPGRAPFLLLIGLMGVISIGGPGSLIGFAHARKHIPLENMGTADGIINAAGFYSTLLAMFGVGVLLQIGGGYSQGSFKIAFLALYPIWILGIIKIRKYNNQLKRYNS
ncbi:MAG: MFS transporter [Actinobacteria bacterium]|nr:MAG: MFS transporter [Actinomycetota bacterium]